MVRKSCKYKPHLPFTASSLSGCADPRHQGIWGIYVRRPSSSNPPCMKALLEEAAKAVRPVLMEIPGTCASHLKIFPSSFRLFRIRWSKSRRTRSPAQRRINELNCYQVEELDRAITKLTLKGSMRDMLSHTPPFYPGLS